MRNRTKEDKKQALAEQEALLQERIDRAQIEMQKAIQIREEMGMQKDESRQAAAAVETQVTRQRTNDQIARQRTNEGVPSRNPSYVPPPEQETSIIVGGETPASKSSKAPTENVRRSIEEEAEERKMQELRRIRQEAKAAEAERQRRNMLNQEEDSPWLKNEIQKMHEPKKETVPLALHQQQQQQPLADDSDSDESNEDENDLRRSIPGQQSHFQMARAQISTIQYQQPENSRSPRNILAPDLGSSIGSTKLQKNQKLISLGIN